MNRSGTVQAVLKQMRRDIVFKNLKDESPVIELKFAQKYGCSRAALRGALTVLDKEGLIRVMPNGTKRISSMSNDDINNLYEMRTYVECSAARHILNKDHLDILRLIKVMEMADDMDFIECDSLFHEMLVDISDNKVLKQVWRTIAPVIRELFLLNFSHSEKIRDTLKERHLIISKMLFEKDEKVIDVIKNHITEARMLSVLE